ncbi:hypothetical protein LCGC14_1247260, partial [marine sediment metagenome]
KASDKNVKTLQGLLPICSACKKIRDDAGYWKQIEEYISTHSEVDFTHSICPECIKKALNNYNITSYVWGSMVVGKVQKRCGKAHCLITYRLRKGKLHEYETLCGIYDTCGNW